MKKNVIAIDGPAGAGKSTVAKKVAGQLGFVYIDTGAMYRAVTTRVIDLGISLEDETSISCLADRINIQVIHDGGVLRVYVDSADVTDRIRNPEVTAAVPKVSRIPAVRNALVRLQREMASIGSAVLDGRDIGTVVVPDACTKIFLTASPDERARRRWLEMIDKGYEPELAELKREILERDRQDSEREIAPLIMSPDSVLVDTTGLSIETVAAKIVEIYLSRCKNV